MDPVEPNSSETQEYHVLKEKIFEIQPRKAKLEPLQMCNISLKYNIKEENKKPHSLKIVFQIVNGKPLIFELFGETHNEKEGILEIRNRTLDFHSVPMGFVSYYFNCKMVPIVSPIEIKNIGGLKLKYKIDTQVIDRYNKENDEFTIFKLENVEGTLGQGDIRYIIGYFRPLTQKNYHLSVPIEYSDEINKEVKEFIYLSGVGYHPLTESVPNYIASYESMPKNRFFNEFDGKMIQRCGVSLEVQTII